MADTPRLGITLMATNDIQKEVIFNEAIIAFDALVARSAKERRNSPPPSAVDGDAYIVGASPTSTWAGHANEIAFWFNGWRFITPTEKMKFFVENVSAFWTFSSGAWTQDAAGTPTVLNDLADVAATSPTNGDTLVWNSELNQWQASVPNLVADLADLGDVDFSTPPTNGQIMIYNEGLGKWVPATGEFGAQQLGDLSDVDMSGRSNNDVLTWNGPGNVAEWRAPPEAVYNVVSALLDVNTDGVQPNDALVWNGAVWAPSSVAFNYSFQGMIDGPGTMEGFANHFMVVDPTESALQFISLSDLLETSDFKLQDLADMPTDEITDADINKVVQLYKDGSEYKFRYAAMEYSIPFFNGETQLTNRIISLRFNGFNVTEPTEGNIVVTNANPIEYQAAGTPVGGDPISAINFTGAGVGVTNNDGTLVVTVANSGGALQTLDDTNIVSPTDGQALVFDALSGKWINGEGAATLPEIDGLAEAALYELGPFAPPTAAMFPLRYNAASADITQVPNRGLMVQPGPQASGIRHAAITRQVTNTTAPWVVTARVVPSGRVSGHAAGIIMQRSANNALVFLEIGESSGDTQSIMRFGHVNAAGTETSTLTAAAEFNWLRLGYDGNDIIAWVSNDGLLWHQFGTLSAATVLGGPPDRVGIDNRSNAAHSGNIGALVTYYEDPDFPAAVRITQGVVSIGLNGLTDVDLESVPPVDGQTIVWDEDLEMWVPGNATGAGSVATLSDVDLSTPPAQGQTLVWDSVDSKWKPGAGGGGGGDASDVDISVFLPGVPDGEQVVMSHVVARGFIFDAGMIDSVARSGVASDDEVVFAIRKNGVQFATLTFDTSDEGVFVCDDPVTFEPGDVLSITSPVSLLNLADVAITLAGRR